ncbi:anthranilate phosphoribosyltransferase [Sugiyamaella lignohabitans]|uniref:Anthranilate phosphoribosyltransferase n=1 Tax=Sugiyamaella lignohabitans TaxID=796027 RepID=A0A167D9N9_9ASCO|nr:anthranilate phosphoribosyltransferase [Sugiyamaella lignohabitans]ANB12652.1 anthranilate phosphoribosyltransferase [Sugiyamaella lignohabitans]
MTGKVNLTPQLRKLLQRPPQLTPEDVVAALDVMIAGDADDIQVAAFLTALRITGLDHSADFIASTATRIFEESHKLDTSTLNPEGYVDIVGTGGDGKNTFNVSTTAAIVASGIGLNICKHGGKASTSTSGSGDLLRFLGVKMENVNHLTAPGILNQSKYCFLFAPVFHPMMASLAPLRKTLGIPTIFNIMGPLINPAPLKARIIGVYSEPLGRVFAEAVLQMNIAAGRPNSPALIVWGTEGLDEISIDVRTKVWELKNQKISEYYVEPADFGIQRHTLCEVASGTPQQNSEVVRKLLANELPENDPVLDYVLINTAALAVVEGTARDWKHGVELARESIRSGAAKNALAKFVALSEAAATH